MKVKKYFVFNPYLLLKDSQLKLVDVSQRKMVANKNNPRGYIVISTEMLLLRLVGR